MTLTRPSPPSAQLPVPPQQEPGRPPYPPTSDSRFAIVVDVVATISLVCLWVAAQALVLGGLSEHRAQSRNYDELRTQLAAATAPTGGVITPGDPVALLRIPALHRDLVVVEGTASGDLLAGPGHRRDTALPGQEGVSLVYGRARTYGAPFADVPSLRPGQQIVARTAQGRAVFTVDDVRRAGDPVPAPPAAGHARLTLVTAEGAGPLGALAAGHVVYVDASMAGQAFVAPVGRLPGVPSSERAMGRDIAALPLLVVGLFGLIAVVVGAILARTRWSTPLVWLVAAPVVLALAWSTTDVAVRLLPNLL